MRRARQRKGAALAIGEQELDVLAGKELHAFVGRQLEADHHHVGGDAFQLLYAAGQRLDWDVARGIHLARFEREVGQRLRAAKQRHAGSPLVGGQRAVLGDAEVDRAGEHLALAGTAGAVLAAVGQVDAGIEGGFEDGGIGCHAELMAAGLEGDLMRHAIIVR